MTEIIIDPITRISGFMEIQAEAEDKVINTARVEGLLFRGFDKMLQGRPPLDAVFFTERICGICSAAHSYASSLALDAALKLTVSQNDRYLRDIIHGFEFVQNHLRHFYIMQLPGYAKIKVPAVANVTPFTDNRLPEAVNQLLEEHYAMSFEYSRLAHEGQAVLAAKAPHNHGIFAGGVTTQITAYRLEKVKAAIGRLKAFVSTVMKEDVQILAQYYPDYFQMGRSYPYFMSYGVFDYTDPEISYVNPGVMADGVHYPLQPEVISKQVRYAWFNNEDPLEVDRSKPDAYTFIQAARYNGMPMEVGPLARMLISGNYSGGNSCMDRIIARVLETEKVLTIIERLAERVELLPNGQSRFTVPDTAQGIGLIDTTRGSLGHWLNIKGQKIGNYSVLTPTNWNLSPKDDKGVAGVIEKALTGTRINNMQSPVELGRIVRSFDPCVSCATHLMTKDGVDKVIEVPV